MSSPFIYNPEPSYPGFTPNTFQYSTPQNSPFIPTTSLHYSPFGNTVPLPGSPLLGSANFFPTDDIYEYGSAWNVPKRQRRPSWHGGMGNLGTPLLPTTFLEADPTGYYRDTRRRSFGSTSTPLDGWNPAGFSTSSYADTNWPSYQSASQFQLHPLVNGTSPRPDFLFNLAAPSFAPSRFIAPGAQAIPVSMEDLKESATNPAITRMRIVHDRLPQWPIDLSYNPYFQEGGSLLMGVDNPQPIRVVDILIAVHRALQRRISHMDWARLTSSEETAVTKAFTHRCLKHGPGADSERLQGVKRVDFLLGKIWFRGLVPAGDVMRLITS